MENNENKTPVTEEVKTETASPAVEEKKEEIKEETKTEAPATETTAATEEKPAETKPAKKSLFAKQKKPWEEDKPKDPLDRMDMLCIAGFVFFLILAFTPYFLRFLDSSYDDTKKFSLKEDDSANKTVTKTTRKQLNCNISDSGPGFDYNTEIVNIYENGEIVNNEIKYTVEIKDASVTLDTVEIEEFTTLAAIQSDGITAEHTAGSDTFILKINYRTDPSLKTNTALSDHFKAFGIQKSDYEEKGFVCTEEKLEG